MRRVPPPSWFASAAPRLGATALPALDSVHRGVVTRLLPDFGAFVRLEGPYDEGLVHVSHLRPGGAWVRDISECISVNDQVYCSVLGIKPGGKIDLSMSNVDQSTGVLLSIEDRGGPRAPLLVSHGGAIDTRSHSTFLPSAQQPTSRISFGFAPDRELGLDFEFDSDVGRLVVTKVQDGSQATACPLLCAGMVVVAVNGFAVSSLDDFESQIVPLRVALERIVIAFEERGAPSNSVVSQLNVPALGSVHRGFVVASADYGLFVKLDEYYDGLVHHTQILRGHAFPDREAIERHFPVGTQVYCSIRAIKPHGKLELSMANVHQSSGVLLDTAPAPSQEREAPAVPAAPGDRAAASSSASPSTGPQASDTEKDALGRRLVGDLHAWMVSRHVTEMVCGPDLSDFLSIHPQYKKSATPGKGFMRFAITNCGASKLRWIADGPGLGGARIVLVSGGGGVVSASPSSSPRSEQSVTAPPSRSFVGVPCPKCSRLIYEHCLEAHMASSSCGKPIVSRILVSQPADSPSVVSSNRSSPRPRSSPEPGELGESVAPAPVESPAPAPELKSAPEASKVTKGRLNHVSGIPSRSRPDRSPSPEIKCIQCGKLGTRASGFWSGDFCEAACKDTHESAEERERRDAYGAAMARERTLALELAQNRSRAAR